jgi:DNA polymerase-3 subunit beta
MKFVISTSELNQMINKIQNIVSQKPTMPILSNFLIEAFDDELILTATDLSVGIRCHMDAQILEEGATTLPAKTFSSLVRELVAPTIQISTNANHITTLISGTSRFKINGMSKSDYPELPELKTACSFSIDQAVLKDLLYRTAFAISKDDNRYILTGCHMQVSSGHVIFVGTDGKRLARSFASLELDPEINYQCVIPSKAIEEILKNLNEEGKPAKIFIMQDKIAVEANQTLLLAKLLSGEYPDITRVIPEKTDIKLTLHRNELITMLRQIALFRPDNNHSARFTFSEGELQLTANTSEVGEGHVAMPVNYHGEKLEVALNPGYFLDILRHCKGETVTMGLIDSYNPGIIVDGEELEKSMDASPLFIIMPMRLSED